MRGGSDNAESVSSADDDTRGLLASVEGSHQASGGRDDEEAGHDVEGGGGPSTRQALMTEEEEEELAYSAAHVTSILKPVAATMIMVILCIKTTQAGATSNPQVHLMHIARCPMTMLTRSTRCLRVGLDIFQRRHPEPLLGVPRGVIGQHGGTDGLSHLLSHLALSHHSPCPSPSSPMLLGFPLSSLSMPQLPVPTSEACVDLQGADFCLSPSPRSCAGKALINSFVILMVVLTMTFVFYLLYKYNCMKVPTACRQIPRLSFLASRLSSSSSSPSLLPAPPCSTGSSTLSHPSPSSPLTYL